MKNVILGSEIGSNRVAHPQQEFPEVPIKVEIIVYFTGIVIFKLLHVASTKVSLIKQRPSYGWKLKIPVNVVGGLPC